MDIDVLTALGQKSGLEGKALAEFVFDKTQETERENRKYKRDSIRDEQEIEYRRKIDREERERRFQLEQEGKKSDRDSEKEIISLQIKLEETRLAAQSSHSSERSHGIKASIPKLPPFEDGKDHLDAYLQRFERFALSQDWKPENWAINLSALLKGKALDVYSRLPSEEANDYHKLKQALLKRYNLTEDGFRVKFRTCKPEVEETPSQFAVRLNSYFLNWIDLAKLTHDFESVKDLILREEFINSCGTDLAVFLRERTPKDVTEMARLAEKYTEAHGNAIFQTGYKKAQIRPSPVTPSREREENMKPSDKICFVCNKRGHIAKDCRFRHDRKPQFKMASMQHYREQPRYGRYERKYQPRNVDWKYGGNKGTGCNFRQGESHQPDAFAACRVKPTNGLDDCCATKDHVILRCGHELPLMSAACKDTGISKIKGMPTTEGFVGSRSASVLRDSGCSGVVIRRSFVDDKELTGQMQTCVLIDGTVRKAPTARIRIDTPYFVGCVEAVCMNDPVYDLILGNIDKVRDPGCPDEHWMATHLNSKESEPQKTKDKMMQTHAVETREMKKNRRGEEKPLKTPDIKLNNISSEEFKVKQKQDVKLRRLYDHAETTVTKKTKGGTTKFVIENEILYRIFESSRPGHDKVYKQLIVPEIYQEQVIQLAHDALLGGHMGVRKTMDRITSSFYWPGIQGDVTRFCRSCDICQRTVPKGNVGKVPLCNMPLIDVPFKRIAVDLVGPIFPITDKGNRYILTIVDYATRYPEAVPLKRIEAHTVAEALVDVYSRVGVPEEILTDMGSQFTADLMKEVGRLLSMRQITTTPYHPMCNGLVEKFNGTLKRMLKKMCAERPQDWDRYLTPLLFAYREAPQASLGFSPFQLLYGREVRGPMTILKEVWTKENTDPEVKSTYEYVIDLRQRLEETLKFAQTELKRSSAIYKKYYDRKAKSRRFKVGDSALILLPTNNNKLLMQWQGPYQVTDTIGHADYRLDVKGKTKTYHANMLKKYIHREKTEEPAILKQPTQCAAGFLESMDAGAAVIEAEEELENYENPEEDALLEGVFHLPPLEAKETLSEVKVADDLTDGQKRDVEALLTNYDSTLTDLPGKTSIATHDIKVICDDPVRIRQYPLPYALLEEVKKEVEVMLTLGVIEPSSSPYSSPIVIVKKKDKTNRFCVDFRQLNRKTVFDAEPMPVAEDIFTKLTGSQYYSKIDLSKGYWQIELSESAKEKTAFSTPQGLFQFRVMPFGLVNAPATFTRLMRKVLAGLQNVQNYVDDILVHHAEWNDHMITLDEVFCRLKEANLTAKPSKCMIGYSSIEFLGHIVGADGLSPHPDKVVKIKEAPLPQTKKQLRSFLGLVGFCRKFMPNFAAVAVPLTDMTKKGQPNHLKWDEPQQKSFHSLKSMLITPPVLQLPDFEQSFILQTDASDNGIGAVLLQEHGGEMMPISYASKKLLPRERSYSVIERECLALVWAVKKYQSYIYGKEFVLQTDHQPLAYLTKAKVVNGRLMRWALYLQAYRIKIQAIKGSANVVADFLSRSV